MWLLLLQAGGVGLTSCFGGDAAWPTTFCVGKPHFLCGLRTSGGGGRRQAGSSGGRRAALFARWGRGIHCSCANLPRTCKRKSKRQGLEGTLPTCCASSCLAWLPHCGTIEPHKGPSRRSLGGMTCSACCGPPCKGGARSCFGLFAWQWSGPRSHGEQAGRPGMLGGGRAGGRLRRCPRVPAVSASSLARRTEPSGPAARLPCDSRSAAAPWRPGRWCSAPSIVSRRWRSTTRQQDG